MYLCTSNPKTINIMIDYDILITGGVGVVTTVVGSCTSWIFARKKYNAEVDSTKIENLAKIIDVQNEQIKNLQERLNNSLERNKQLEQEVIELRKQMSDLMMQLINRHIVIQPALIEDNNEKDA